MNLNTYIRAFDRALPVLAEAKNASTAMARVEGVDEMLQALQLFSQLLKITAQQADYLLAKRTAEAIREKAPLKTGALRQGVTFRREGDDYVIEASAIREAMNGWEADYAMFQEYGTENMEANPFFWDTAREMLGDRMYEEHDRALERLAVATGLAATAGQFARNFGSGVLEGATEELFGTILGV